MDRDKFKSIIEENGGKVISSISSKTSYLVAGEGGGGKRESAEKLGVPVINEDGLNKLMSLEPE